MNYLGVATLVAMVCAVAGIAGVAFLKGEEQRTNALLLALIGWGYLVLMGVSYTARAYSGG
jgi:FtsH-binding integral membrane protein